MNVQSVNVYRKIDIDIIMDTGAYAGTVSGDFSIINRSLFRIQNIYLKPEFENETVISQALCETVSAAKNAGAECVRWRYFEPEGVDYTDEKNDPHIRLMQPLILFSPGLELKRTIHGRDYRINMTILPERMQHDYHISEQWISDAGIEFIPLEDMKPFVPQISALVAEDQDADLLSPLGLYNYDSDTSFIAVCKGEVMGWVTCMEIDNDTVIFTGFYTAKKFRSYRRGGTVLITVAIRRIQAKYSAVNLFLDDKSRSLKRFYPHYFGSALSEGLRWFFLDLNLK